jgi:hypothetical protein
MRNGGRVLLSVLNLCVRIKIRVATLDTNHSVTDFTQSIAASVQKFPVSVKSVGRARHSRRVRRNDQLINQFEVSRQFFTCYVV